MKAKYSGKCFGCSGRIWVGDEVSIVNVGNRRQQTVHSECRVDKPPVFGPGKQALARPAGKRLLCERCGHYILPGDSCLPFREGARHEVCHR